MIKYKVFAFKLGEDRINLPASKLNLEDTGLVVHKSSEAAIYELGNNLFKLLGFACPSLPVSSINEVPDEYNICYSDSRGCIHRSGPYPMWRLVKVS